MFDRELLLIPGILLAALGGLVLVTGRERRGPYWGYDLMGAIGAAAGALLIYESRRDASPRLELTDLFDGLFDGWLEAVLITLIAAGVLLVAVILLRRAIPAWQRVAALSFGVVAVGLLAHLWSAGL